MSKKYAGVQGGGGSARGAEKNKRWWGCLLVSRGRKQRLSAPSPGPLGRVVTHMDAEEGKPLRSALWVPIGQSLTMTMTIRKYIRESRGIPENECIHPLSYIPTENQVLSFFGVSVAFACQIIAHAIFPKSVITGVFWSETSPSLSHIRPSLSLMWPTEPDCNYWIILQSTRKIHLPWFFPPSNYPIWNNPKKIRILTSKHRTWGTDPAGLFCVRTIRNRGLPQWTRLNEG